jgi:formate-dependent nitrite reductase cytochrome c552 subunit
MEVSMTKEEMRKAKAKMNAQHRARMDLLQEIQGMMINNPEEALRLLREELPELPYNVEVGAWDVG